MTWVELAPGLGVLLAGHYLADFVLPSTLFAPKEGASSRSGFYRAGRVFVTHALILCAWFPHWHMVLVALAATAVHSLSAVARSAAHRRCPDRGPWWFYAQQLVNLAALAWLASFVPGDARSSEVASAWRPR